MNLHVIFTLSIICPHRRHYSEGAQRLIKVRVNSLSNPIRENILPEFKELGSVPNVWTLISLYHWSVASCPVKKHEWPIQFNSTKQTPLK